jgi:erythromycin esterase
VLHPWRAVLAPLVAGAGVVCWAEGPHHVHEFLTARNDAIRVLVEEHGLTAIAAETGFTEAGAADAFVLGGDDEAAALVGAWSWGGALAENRDLLRWLRAHNAGAARPVRFYGLDPCGGRRGRFPQARVGLDAVLEALPPDVAPGFRARLDLDRFNSDSYATLAPDERDAISAAIADLGAVPTSRRAQHQCVLAAHLDVLLRGGGRANQVAARGLAQYDSLRWVLDEEGPDGRVFVFAHVDHLDRTLSGTLAHRLGDDAVYVGAAWGDGREPAPESAESRALALAGCEERCLVERRGGPFAAAVFVPRCTPAQVLA